MKISKIEKLQRENKVLKETCEILADKKILGDIKISLEQIRKGKGIPLSEL